MSPNYNIFSSKIQVTFQQAGLIFDPKQTQF